jgi:hypothetical protein
MLSLQISVLGHSGEKPAQSKSWQSMRLSRSLSMLSSQTSSAGFIGAAGQASASTKKLLQRSRRCMGFHWIMVPREYSPRERSGVVAPVLCGAMGVAFRRTGYSPWQAAPRAALNANSSRRWRMVMRVWCMSLGRRCARSLLREASKRRA